jgi:hypothetical protein
MGRKGRRGRASGGPGPYHRYGQPLPRGFSARSRRLLRGHGSGGRSALGEPRSLVLWSDPQATTIVISAACEFGGCVGGVLEQ